MCRDNLEIDAELPHLNQTSSNLIQFKNKDKDQTSVAASISINSGAGVYAGKTVTSSTNSMHKRKKSTGEKVKRSSEHPSVLSKVQETINTRFVQNPQIMSYTAKKNQSTTNLQGLNRSGAERNLNQSSMAGAPKKQNHTRMVIDQS